MLKNCLFIVLSLFVLSCYCQNSNDTFAGLWTDDRYGGNFSICVSGDSANGLYSEYGLAIGSLTDNGTVWTGMYYEGGNTECSVGVFSLNLIANGTQLAGKWGCREKLTYKWTATRINSDTQSDYDCATVIDLTSRNNNLDGRWWSKIEGKTALVDFCTESNGKYQSSYSQPTYTPEGYDEGTYYESHKVATGVFYRANNNGALPGRSIWFINPDGNLANIWWAGMNSELNIAAINDTKIHSYDIYEFLRGTTTPECSRYEALAKQDFDYYPYEQELFYFDQYVIVNNASTLACSLVLLLISLLFC